MQALFFDLDGTLVDSSKGITESFQHTFDTLKVPQPDLKTIRSFMGPPLISSFEATLPETLVDQAVTIYRQYYHKKGQYKSTLFPQIVEALKALQDENIPLYVTTSKHEPVALQMCQDFGIKTMAVTWGFGDLEELLLYSPDFICHSPLDILETLKK